MHDRASILRNRTTSEIFDALGKPLKKRFDFKTKPQVKPHSIKVAALQDSKTSDLDKLFDEDLNTKLTEKRINFLKQLDTLADEGSVNSMFSFGLAKQHPQLWSAAKVIAKILVASYLPTVAAVSGNYSCTPGSWDPSSACSLTDTSCRFGILSKDEVILAKFMTKVVQDAGPHDNTPFTLYDCMDINKMCKILQHLFNISSDPSVTLPATGQGPTINGTYLYATVDAIPKDVQPGFPGAFSAQAAECDSFLAQLKADLKLLALLVLILIPITIYVYRNEIKDKFQNLSCPDFSNFSITLGGSRAPEVKTTPTIEPPYQWTPGTATATDSVSASAPLSIVTEPTLGIAESYASQPGKSPRQFQAAKSEPELADGAEVLPPPPSYADALATDQTARASMA